MRAAYARHPDRFPLLCAAPGHPHHQGHAQVAGRLDHRPQVQMSQDVRDAPAGALVARHGIFTPAELDAIEQLGESLTPMKAEIAGRKDNTDYLRITRVAWIERAPQTAWLYERIEQTVLDLNSQFYKFDLYG